MSTTKHTEGLLVETSGTRDFSEDPSSPVFLDSAQGMEGGNSYTDEDGNPAWHSVALANGPDRKENARRIRACWNAFDGLTTEQVEAIGAGGVKELVSLVAEMFAHVEDLDDQGPVGEGYQSKELVRLIERSRAILARLQGK